MEFGLKTFVVDNIYFECLNSFSLFLLRTLLTLYKGSDCIYVIQVFCCNKFLSYSLWFANI